MRVLKALCLVVVVCLIAPLPTASAAPAQSFFAITMIDDLVAPVAGRPVIFDTTLLTTDGAVGDAPVSLEVRPYGSAVFSTAATTTTDAAGHVAVTLALTRTTSYRWIFPGNGTYAPAASPTLVRRIAPRVTARSHDRTLRRGQRFVVRGRTYPVKAGCTVVLLRGHVRPLTIGPRPVRLARATVRSDGSYRLVHRFHKKARLRVVVKVASCAGNAVGFSPSLRVRVR